MDMQKFYTKEVEIYENIKELNAKMLELKGIRNFIKDNYDSKIKVSINASSSHNYNKKSFKEIAVPIDIILGQKITKESVLTKLDLEIKNIEEQIKKLDIEFDNLSK